MPDSKQGIHTVALWIKGYKKKICVLRDGKPIPELLSIFRLCREYDAVLGTAHLSPAECFTVVEAARAAGVRKIVVTHPEWWLVGMSLEDQVRIVRDYASRERRFGGR